MVATVLPDLVTGGRKGGAGSKRRQEKPPGGVFAGSPSNTPSNTWPVRGQVVRVFRNGSGKSCQCRALLSMLNPATMGLGMEPRGSSEETARCGRVRRCAKGEVLHRGRYLLGRAGGEVSASASASASAFVPLALPEWTGKSETCRSMGGVVMSVSRCSRCARVSNVARLWISS